MFPDNTQITKITNLKYLTPFVLYCSADKHYYISLLYRIQSIGIHYILCSKLNPMDVREEIPQLIEIMLKPVDGSPISYPIYTLLLKKARKNTLFRFSLFLRLKSVLSTVEESMASHCYFLCCDILEADAMDYKRNLSGFKRRREIAENIKKLTLKRSKDAKSTPEKYNKGIDSDYNKEGTHANYNKEGPPEKYNKETHSDYNKEPHADYNKEGTPADYNKEGTPADYNKEPHADYNKEGTPADYNKETHSLPPYSTNDISRPPHRSQINYIFTDFNKFDRPINMSNFKKRIIPLSRQFSIPKRAKSPNFHGLMLFFVESVVSLFNQPLSKELHNFSSTFQNKKNYRNLQFRLGQTSFKSNVMFYENLSDISSTLKKMPPHLRHRTLKILLEFTNLQIGNEILDPFNKGKRILKLAVEYAKTQDSAENCPFIVVAECADTNGIKYDLYSSKVKKTRALLRQLESLNDLDDIGDIDGIKESIISAIESVLMSPTSPKGSIFKQEKDLIFSVPNITLIKGDSDANESVFYKGAPVGIINSLVKEPVVINLIERVDSMELAVPAESKPDILNGLKGPPFDDHEAVDNTINNKGTVDNTINNKEAESAIVNVVDYTSCKGPPLGSSKNTPGVDVGLYFIKSIENTMSPFPGEAESPEGIVISGIGPKPSEIRTFDTLVTENKFAELVPGTSLEPKIIYDNSIPLSAEIKMESDGQPRLLAPTTSIHATGSSHEFSPVPVNAYSCDGPDARPLATTNGMAIRPIKEALLGTSPYTNSPGWDVVSFIVKCGGILKHEYLAYQTLSQMKEIFIIEKLPIYLRNYQIFLISDTSGLVETVQNAQSIHRIKFETKFKTLQEYFQDTFRDGDFVQAKENFLFSLVGYSLASYILQIKDRHNGNILVDAFGHIVHVDFGFTFGKFPGMFAVENAPFKFSSEYLELIDIEEFKSLFISGFKALRKHKEKVTRLIEVMKESGYYDKAIFDGILERFRACDSEAEIETFCLTLIANSIGSKGTALYDHYQHFFNGYL